MSSSNNSMNTDAENKTQQSSEKKMNDAIDKVEDIPEFASELKPLKPYRQNAEVPDHWKPGT